eukprot:TRINITY_DN18683_c0_g1_i2.p1 TRINITY_DN18683_c0_g1~~TRINITY_DN18683_c0_g1_i2.p1  ORF type:complete len:275 (+),score=71.19 TRINITY_DN18683_c0_g1_i2:128-952(+)
MCIRDRTEMVLMVLVACWMVGLPAIPGLHRVCSGSGFFGTSSSDHFIVCWNLFSSAVIGTWFIPGSAIIWYTVDHQQRIDQLVHKSHTVNDETSLLEWHSMLSYHLRKANSIFNTGVNSIAFLWLLLLGAVACVLSLFWGIASGFDVHSANFMVLFLAAAGLNIYILLIMWRGSRVEAGFRSVINILQTRFCDPAFIWHADSMRKGWEQFFNPGPIGSVDVSQSQAQWIHECQRLAEFYPVFGRILAIVPEPTMADEENRKCCLLYTSPSPRDS